MLVACLKLAQIRKQACEQEYGKCVWGRISPKLYFKHGTLSSTTHCGFGVTDNPVVDKWDLDISGCGSLQKEPLVEKWNENFLDLRRLVLDDNELEKVPDWLGKENLTKLEHFVARNNTLKEFPRLLGESKLTLVDVR